MKENFRLTIFPAIEIGAKCVTFMFETKYELMAAKNTSADLLLFLQDKLGIMYDYSNIFTCEELINGEWQESEETNEGLQETT